MAHLKLQGEVTSEISTNIINDTKKKFGFVPNMYKKLAHNAALLDAHTYSYDSFRANSGFTPVEQEVVLLSVAYVNNCEYLNR